MRPIITDLLESKRNVLFVGADSGQIAAHALAVAYNANAAAAERITLVDISREEEFRREGHTMWCYTPSTRILKEETLGRFPIRVSIQNGHVVGLLKYREEIA